MSQTRELRPLRSLQRTARNRKQGYLERCIELSEQIIIEGDEFRQFTPDNWMKIREEFRRGVGDLVSSVATPIAAAVGLPCADKITKQLKADSGCAGRRDWLNENIKLTLPG